jgi:hypothetical protein
MSAAGRALSKALDSPLDWVWTDKYVITHKPSKQVFWVANGGFFFDGDEGTPKCLGLIERYWLYAKVKRARSAVVVARFDGAAS